MTFLWVGIAFAVGVIIGAGLMFWWLATMEIGPKF